MSEVIALVASVALSGAVISLSRPRYPRGGGGQKRRREGNVLNEQDLAKRQATEGTWKGDESHGSWPSTGVWREAPLKRPASSPVRDELDLVRELDANLQKAKQRQTSHDPRTLAMGPSIDQKQRPWYMTQDEWDKEKTKAAIRKYREEQAEDRRLDQQYEDTMNFVHEQQSHALPHTFYNLRID